MTKTQNLPNGHGIEGALRSGIAKATSHEDRANLAGPLAVIEAMKRGATIDEARAASRKARNNA